LKTKNADIYADFLQMLDDIVDFSDGQLRTQKEGTILCFHALSSRLTVDFKNVDERDRSLVMMEAVKFMVPH
jgi:hypothetical protein